MTYVEMVRTAIGSVTVIGSGIALYVGIQVEQAAVVTDVAHLRHSHEQLYDFAHDLEHEVEKNTGDLVRTNVVIGHNEKNQERLTSVMDSLGKEIRVLSNAIIRAEQKDKK